jgi:hypothetical protein
MNAAHPGVWREAMRSHPVQRRKSRYVALFRLPWLPEFLLRRNRFDALANALRQQARSNGISQTELDRYRSTWAVPRRAACDAELVSGLPAEGSTLESRLSHHRAGTADLG